MPTSRLLPSGGDLYLMKCATGKPRQGEGRRFRDCRLRRLAGAQLALPEEEVVAVGVGVAIGVGEGADAERVGPLEEVRGVDLVVVVEVARQAARERDFQQGSIEKQGGFGRIELPRLRTRGHDDPAQVGCAASPGTNCCGHVEDDVHVGDVGEDREVRRHRGFDVVCRNSVVERIPRGAVAPGREHAMDRHGRDGACRRLDGMEDEFG